MLVLLSPSKAMDFPVGEAPFGRTPRFARRAAELVGALERLDQRELGRLLGVSERLARLNAERFERWGTPRSPQRPAALAYVGDTYKEIPFDEMGSEELDAFDQRVRILSGLYGLLRPLDAIEPYRLEMGTRLAIGETPDLYRFWGDELTRALAEDIAASGASYLVNCASAEYAKAIDVSALGVPVIVPRFEDEKGGTYKVISFYAKRARGRMAHFIASTGASAPSDLRAFRAGGYDWVEGASSEERPIFRRPESAR